MAYNEFSIEEKAATGEELVSRNAVECTGIAPTAQNNEAADRELLLQEYKQVQAQLNSGGWFNRLSIVVSLLTLLRVSSQRFLWKEVGHVASFLTLSVVVCALIVCLRVQLPLERRRNQIRALLKKSENVQVLPVLIDLRETETLKRVLPQVQASDTALLSRAHYAQLTAYVNGRDKALAVAILKAV